MKKTIVLMLFCVSFGYSQTYNGKKKDIKKILKNTEQFSEYIMTSNYNGIAASYTKDAKIFPNNTKILEGKDIIKYWTLPEGVRVTFHKITQTEITVKGKTAYDYGYYEGKTKHKNGTSSWKGKYLIVWKKIDGKWKMHLDIWNAVKNKK